MKIKTGYVRIDAKGRTHQHSEEVDVPDDFFERLYEEIGKLRPRPDEPLLLPVHPLLWAEIEKMMK